MSNFTLVYYYVPEDGESQAELNTYGVPKAKENLTLRDIKSSFPLKGKYVFRFLTKHAKSNIFVDVLSDDDNVPFADKRLVVKANRIAWPAAPVQDSPIRVTTEPVPPPKVEQRHADNFDFDF